VDGRISQKPVPSWGLARISSSSRLPDPLPPPYVNLPYTYDSTAGAGTRAYVLDTGIMINHDVSHPSSLSQFIPLYWLGQWC
jgi:hypothetical protein